MTQKPQTPFEWALERTRLSCMIGANALETKEAPNGVDISPLEYAVYSLLNALQSVADALRHLRETP